METLRKKNEWKINISNNPQVISATK